MNIRTIVGVAVIMVCMAGAAGADYCPTEVSWPGWKVTSSENLYAGVRHTSYPLTHLFDGRPETAWAPSGKGVISAPNGPIPACLDDGRTVITLYPDKPVAITAIRLMTGYNKSPELFAANDRAAEVRLTVNGGYIEKAPRNLEAFTKTAALKDSMGWHTVSLDGRKVWSLRIEVTRRHKGTSGDLCLSELELYDGDTRIDMHMPEVVRFTRGDECGCGLTHWLMQRDGTRLCHDDGEQLGLEEATDADAAWSPGGRFVAVIEYNKKQKSDFLCVFDAATGERVVHQAIHTAALNLKWRGEKTVVLEYFPGAKPPMPVQAVAVPGAVAKT
jgi:hypothetical protein